MEIGSAIVDLFHTLDAPLDVKRTLLDDRHRRLARRGQAGSTRCQNRLHPARETGPLTGRRRINGATASNSSVIMSEAAEGQAGRLRFDPDQRQPFIQRRQKEQIHSSDHQARDIVAASGEDHVRRQPRLGNLSLDLRTQSALADEQETYGGIPSHDLSRNIDQQRVIFLLDKSPDVADDECIGGQASAIRISCRSIGARYEVRSMP